MTIEEFTKLYKDLTIVDLAKKLNVSRQTIYIKAKELGLAKGKGAGAGRKSKISIT